MDFSNYPEILKPEEIADALRISSCTVLNAIKRGDLKAIRAGKVWRIQKLDAIEWLEKSGQK